MPLPRPPSADPLVALADQCVQCGLCLPACPTYRRGRIEAESPRGRIALARGWALEALEPTPAGEAHLDGCLACRSCEAVCPAGVRYGALLVEARRRQRGGRRPGGRQWVIERLAARPRLLTAVLMVYRRFFPVLPAGWRVLPRPSVQNARGANPSWDARRIGRCAVPASAIASATPACASAIGTSDAHPDRTAHATVPPIARPDVARVDGGRREGDVAPTYAPDAPAAPPTSTTPCRPVALFVGCAARAYEPPTRDALRRLLAATGVAVEVPGRQTCCGALHAHAGDAATATALARRNAEPFANAPTVLTLASGCHEALAASLGGQTQAIDAIEFLARRSTQLRFRPHARRVALHLPCTQRNVVRSVGALRGLLAQIPQLDVVELDAGFGCCGAAGTAMLADRDRAASFRAPLLAAIEAGRVDEVLSANLGCRLHLGAGTPIPVRHPLEFLADRLDDPHAPAQ